MLALALAIMIAHVAYATGEAPLANTHGLIKLDETYTTAATGTTWTTGTTGTTGTWTTGTWTTGTWTTGTWTTGTWTSGSGSSSSSSSSSNTSGSTGLLVDVDSAGYVLYEGFPESGDDKTVIFSVQDFDGVFVNREMYVPSDESFSRWIEVFTNTGDSTRTVTALVAADLGSCDELSIGSTSSGDLFADVNDTWIVSVESSGGIFLRSIGHVLQGVGGSVGVSFISFLDGNGLTEWEYSFDLAPGETAILMHFVTAQSDLEVSEAQAIALANLEGCALDSLSETQRGQIINFDISTGGGGGASLDCFGFLGAATGSPPWGDMLILGMVSSLLLALYARHMLHSFSPPA